MLPVSHDLADCAFSSKAEYMGRLTAVATTLRDNSPESQQRKPE
jgi:hypothetical protein